ncbi:MAG: AAA family ATPase, partial [Pseudomonadota bacterium]
MNDTPTPPPSAPGAPASKPVAPLRRVVAGAAPADVDRAVVRLDPSDMAALGVRSGDLVELKAERRTYARVLPTPTARRGEGLALVDDVQRRNLGAVLGAPLTISAAIAEPDKSVRLSLSSSAGQLDAALARRLCAALVDTPVVTGDAVRIRLTDGRALETVVVETRPETRQDALPKDASPEGALPEEASKEDAPEETSDGARAGAVMITAATALTLIPDRAAPDGYAAAAGLDRQIAAVREMVELPMRRPDLFDALGVAPPRGVLFTGPPGSGKTLLARLVAENAGAHFQEINGPEIVSKHYGDSEKRLRMLFETAEKRAPSVIFIDEIDAIAQRRDGMADDRQLEKRVVAQLLTLMDGMRERRGVVVMAATNLPDALDPALRRPGRFDREIAFTPPDPAGRRAILAVHSDGMALGDDVDMEALAEATPGFVGADLAALTREAGVAALRRLRRPDGGYPTDLSKATVSAADFETALEHVGPSVTRDVQVQTPVVRWSDVAGCEEAKQALAEAVIWPRRYASAFRRLRLEPVKGVLLSGPPGGGKTHLARALATEAGVNFIAVRGAQLLSRYLGESERAVRELFAKARQAAP